MVQLLRTTLNDIRNNIDRHHNIWYMGACNMGRSVGTIANKPRISSTQSYRDNILLKMFRNITEDQLPYNS